jgi:hypothetical protein
MIAIAAPSPHQLAEKLLQTERQHLNCSEAGFLRELLRFESPTRKQADRLSEIAGKVHGRKSGALPPPLAPRRLRVVGCSHIKIARRLLDFDHEYLSVADQNFVRALARDKNPLASQIAKLRAIRRDVNLRKWGTRGNPHRRGRQ